MPSRPLFIDSDGTIEIDRIVAEAIPLSKLIGVMGLVAVVPFAIASEVAVLRGLFIALTQFVLAVGSGLVLLYIITRAMQLTEQ